MLKGVRHCPQRSCRSSNASPVLACETKAERGSYESLDEESKRGPCWSELRRAGMTQWISCQTSDTFEQEEQKPIVSSSIIENGLKIEQEDCKVAIVAQANRKRKCRIIGQDEEVKAAKRGRKRQSHYKQTTHNPSSTNRWSAKRYEHAERSMLEILKAEGAVFGNPMSRTALRITARKLIGDTGLLDHLLKHIDGKVAPGGAERFRRWHNTHGNMEYWLESAGLVDIRTRAGVQDPYWIPPLSRNCEVEDPVHNELKLLRAEMANMKNEMQELSSRKQAQDQAEQIEELRRELVSWKANIEQYQIVISNSLSSIQDVQRQLVAWKTKTEQKLVEISNALSSMQSNQSNGFSPLVSERWEDWLDSTNLDNVQEEDLAPWLGNTNLKHKAQEEDSPTHTQALVCAKELELLKEEMAKMKRDVQGLTPKKHDDDQANLTPDSSAMTNPKVDLDNPFLLFQEMCNELVKWKASMEQQLMEMASGMQGSKTLKLSSFESSEMRWK